MAMPGELRRAAARSLLLTATILLSRMLLPVIEEPAKPALVVVVYSCAALLALLIFRPQADTSIARTLGWSLTTTVIFAAILLLDPLTRGIAIAFPGIVMTVLLLSATVGIVGQRMPMSVAVAIFALLTLAPLWAAPAVELAGNPAWLTNAVVASSPLTSIATALDLDYLRTSWFYATSALGSMRYAYPDWISVCVILSLVPLAAVTAGQVGITGAAFQNIGNGLDDLIPCGMAITIVD